jgi:hypothetical protein
MSEKYPLLAEEEGCFFLTSPFIEPDGPIPQSFTYRDAAAFRLLIDLGNPAVC